MIRKAGGSEMVNVVYLMKHTQIINLQSPTKKKPQTKYLERAIFQGNWTAYQGSAFTGTVHWEGSRRGVSKHLMCSHILSLRVGV